MVERILGRPTVKAVEQVVVATADRRAFKTRVKDYERHFETASPGETKDVHPHYWRFTDEDV